jgi:hypothetical protein
LIPLKFKDVVENFGDREQIEQRNERQTEHPDQCTPGFFSVWREPKAQNRAENDPNHRASNEGK